MSVKIGELLEKPELLERELLKLPGEIEQAEQSAADAKFDMEQAKAEMDRVIASRILSSERPNATEKRSEALEISGDMVTNYHKARHAYDIKMASLTALNNKFTALRKVASLELELNK
jgi:hypothetical protein